MPLPFQGHRRTEPAFLDHTVFSRVLFNPKVFFQIPRILRRQSIRRQLPKPNTYRQCSPSRSFLNTRQEHLSSPNPFASPLGPVCIYLFKLLRRDRRRPRAQWLQ